GETKHRNEFFALRAAVDGAHGCQAKGDVDQGNQCQPRVKGQKDGVDNRQGQEHGKKQARAAITQAYGEGDLAGCGIGGNVANITGQVHGSAHAANSQCQQHAAKGDAAD